MKNLSVIQPKCESCSLNHGQENKWVVNGEGQFESPDLFIIGQAPKGIDHYQHRPFMDKSGQILRMTLDEIRKQKDFTHYMTNVVMCRPPDDRAPSQLEMLCCLDRLISEIRLAKPKGLLLLGSFASETLLNEKVTSCRGKLRQWEGIPTIVTWHPGYLLQNQHQFKSFANDIIHLLRATDAEEVNPWSLPREFEVLDKVSNCVDLLDNIRENNFPYSLDFETFDLDPFKGFILWVGIRCNQVNYIIPHSVFIQAIKETVYPINALATVYDSRMEWKWAYHHYGISLENVNDPLLKGHILDERTKQVSKSLKTLGMELLDVHDWSLPVKPYITNMYNCPKEILTEYLSYDIEVADAVDEILDKKLELDGVKDAYINVIQPAIPFIRRLTARGIRLDLEYLDDLAGKWGGPKRDGNGGKLGDARENIRQLVGDSLFNPGSWQQVSKHLYETIGLPQINQTSTDEKTVKELSLQCDDPFLDLLLEYRGHQKIFSTYLMGLMNKCSADGRVHFEYYLEGTATGRLSGDGQQIPRPTEEINIRKAFLPDEDCLLYDADYKMLEVVVGAHLADDDNLIGFINAGRDVYKEVGAVFFKREITKLERQFVKNMVLAVMYNSSISGLVYNFKKSFPFLTEELAEKIIKLIREMFPQLYLRSLSVQQFVLEHNYIMSMFKRKRRFPLIDRWNRNDVLKEAANFPPQSGGSDICLLSGIRIDRECKEVRQHMTNHDSLVGSMPMGYDTKEIINRMEDVPFDHKVNFRVDIKVGERWGT